MASSSQEDRGFDSRAEPMVAGVAKEVDRLVVGVHRQVMVQHGLVLRCIIDPLKLESPGHLMDLAEFFLAQRCIPELARNRFPYDSPDIVDRLFRQLKQRQLLDDNGSPSPELVDLLGQILSARAQISAMMWPEDLTFAVKGASEALSAVSGAVVGVFRELPTPLEPAHRLHHLLTGLRYARLDAHVQAWQGAGLSATEVVDLAVDSDLRMAIEGQTNERCRGMLGSVSDLEAWYQALRSLADDVAV